MAEMITHEGRRYRRADAERMGLIKDQVAVVVGTDEPETVRSEVVEGEVEDTATKVDEPTTTKVREPSTTKRRGSTTK